MPSPGTTVFCVCQGSAGKVKLKAVVVEEDIPNSTAVIAFSSSLAKNLEGAVVPPKPGDTSIAFVRVPTGALAEQLPTGWSEKVGGKPPSLEKAIGAWSNLGSEVQLQSSEAELAPSQARGSGGRSVDKPASSQRKLEAELLQMGQDLFGKDDSEDSEESEEETPEFVGGQKHLPPGAGSVKKEKKGKHEKEKDVTGGMQQVLMQALASGQSASDLMPLMMMGMMMQQQQQQQGSKKEKKSKKQWDVLGSSSSEDSSDSEVGHSGMKSVTSMHRMNKRITKHPKAIVREFERDLVRELGVVPGQAWSIRDYLKKHNWGKFKGIYRTAVQDAAVIEYLRANNPDAACAQCVQNLKSKIQATLQGGDWTTAWMLCGLSDPLSRKEFAGSQNEMAVISGYISSLHKLKKKVKEAKEAGAGKEEEAD